MRGAIRPAHLRDQPNVMNARNGAATVIRAAGESNFELARQIVKIRMPQQVARDTERIGRNVKGFARADACDRASCDVAHRVAASFASSQPAIGQQTHGHRHIFKFDKMELDVFARREMTSAG